MENGEFLEHLYGKVQEDFEHYVKSLEKRNKPLSEKLNKYKYSIFYSHPLRTLKEGFIYFLGINPKGKVQNNYELENYFAWMKTNIEYNSFDKNYEDWGGGLQYNCINILNYLIEELKLDKEYKDILSTNFNFFRSDGVSELKNKLEINFDSCWKYHKEFLNIVKPKIIICFGNREKNLYFDSGYRFIRDNYIISKEEVFPHFKTLLLKKSLISIPENGVILLIGLPHLSPYTPNETTFAILETWIKDFIINF